MRIPVHKRIDDLLEKTVLLVLAPIIAGIYAYKKIGKRDPVRWSTYVKTQTVAKHKVSKALGLIILIFVILPAITFYIHRPRPAKAIKYGITFSNKYAESFGLDWKTVYISILDQLNPKQLRLIAYWDEIEKTPGEYDYYNIKWQLTEAQKRNIPVILTVGRKVPRYPECFAPAWWKTNRNRKYKEEKQYEYIAKTINTLRGYNNIMMWQIENEPFFPFGECEPITWNNLKKEIEIARSLDKRPILVQDSGEGGLWRPTYELGDYLGISMYRKIWYDFWGLFFGKFIYFKYPLAHWTYKIKADMTGVPYNKIIVTELQAEPWGPGHLKDLPQEEKDKTMSSEDFMATLVYAQKSGFTNLYLWGAEWWYWEKEVNHNPFYWNIAKELFNR